MKKIILIAFLSVLLFAQDTLNYAISDKHAYMLPKHHGNILVEYLKLNNQLDIFNIKSQELGSASSYGSIGDMDGFKVQGLYEIGEKSLLGLKYSAQNVKYGSGTLNNKRYEGYYRYQLIQSNFTFFGASALDIGYVGNRANTMSYDNPKFLEPLATKVLKVKQTKIIQNGNKYAIGVIKKNGTTDFISNLVQKPTLYIKDMKDDSFYIRALTEKKISEKFYLSFFLQYTRTKITTLVTANSELNIEAAKKNYETIKVLDRDESRVSGGFNISLNWQKLAWELTYTYSRLFRDSGLDYINYNHVIDATLAKPIGKKWLIYGGVKIMYRQFNAQIPYLYNAYTQSTFDHKYGYAKVGLEYRF